MTKIRQWFEQRLFNDFLRYMPDLLESNDMRDRLRALGYMADIDKSPHATEEQKDRAIGIVTCRSHAVKETISYLNWVIE